MRLPGFSALFLVVFLALPLAAQTEITRNERLGNWALFEDDGYCWMATNGKGLANGDRLLLTVDLAGEAALFLDIGGGALFDDTTDHIMNLGARKVAFRSRGAWAWTKRKSPERLLETILASNEIGYEVHLTGNGDRTRLTGVWETDEARQAYDTLRESCGR